MADMADMAHLKLTKRPIFIVDTCPPVIRIPTQRPLTAAMHYHNSE